MNFDFNEESLKLLKTTLTNSIFLIICYIIVFYVFIKIIKNKKNKAIIIGLVTSLFFYYITLNLIHPLTVLLYVLRIDVIGIVGGLIFFLLKPLSIIAGILMILYMLKNN